MYFVELIETTVEVFVGCCCGCCCCCCCKRNTIQLKFTTLLTRFPINHTNNEPAPVRFRCVPCSGDEFAVRVTERNEDPLVILFPPSTRWPVAKPSNFLALRLPARMRKVKMVWCADQEVNISYTYGFRLLRKECMVG